jgi:hypothetical protein
MPQLFGKNLTKRQLLDMVGDISQVAQVRRAELLEGRERGAGLIEVYNASGLSFSVLPGRALDIAFAHYKGMPLCFRSNTGDVGPAFYEPHGYGWMRGFAGGLVVTCGMSFTGHPEIDPEEENEELGLHGRLSFLPAKNISADGNWEGEDYVLRIRGRMREAVPFGINLELTRELSMKLGEKCFHIYDRIENLDVNKSPLMLAYHCNPGFPILDEGARFIINSNKTTEWTEDREVDPQTYTKARGPAQEMQDDVFVHRPAKDGDGFAYVSLVNDSLNKGLYWKFPQAEMPIVNQWQHFHRGTYVTGIEPGNSSVLGRAWNRKHNTLQYIEPGEVREFHMEIGVLDGFDDIRDIERHIASCIP